MATITWQFLTEAPNNPAANCLVGSLIADGVVSKVVSGDVLLGEGCPCSVFVDAAQFHRAQWLLLQGEFTDEELAFLATGRWTANKPEK